MRISMQVVVLSVGTVVLLFFGCTGETPVDAPTEDVVEIFRINRVADDEVPGASKFFTGRDSFGVALKASVEVAPSGEGTGNATHLGRLTAEQSHEVDLGALLLTEGTFHFTGTNDAYLVGRYEATLEATGDPDTYAVLGDLWVDDGHVEAIDRPAEGQGTIEGTLYPDGTLHYELDGWLLHHVAEDDE